jgi:hypothetical protein
MTDLFESRYNPWWVYALRCALVHTYAKSDAMDKAMPKLKGYLLNDSCPTFHLSGNDDVLRLNVESFITDVVRTAWVFFNDPPPVTPPVDPRIVEERGDDFLVILGLSDADANKPYQKSHRMLRELDNSQPNFDKLYTDIKAILMKRTVDGKGI